MFSLLTGAKSFKANRWVGSVRLNRLGLHTGRKRLADGFAALRRVWLGRFLPAQDRMTLAQDGLLVKSGFFCRLTNWQRCAPSFCQRCGQRLKWPSHPLSPGA